MRLLSVFVLRTDVVASEPCTAGSAGALGDGGTRGEAQIRKSTGRLLLEFGRLWFWEETQTKLPWACTLYQNKSTCP
jgi:hypothetical protein